MDSVEQAQSEICKRYGAAFMPPDLNLRVGISANVFSGELPIVGVRIPPEGNTCGWYIWAGKYSEDADFFQPLCAVHLLEKFPKVIPYLGLPPGWRFVIAPNHEDVWYDEALIKNRESTSV